MFRPFRVVQKIQESQTITSFYLEPNDGGPLLRYQPGQHVTLRLTLPGRTGALLRSYTLSEAPGHPHYRITVKREGTGLVSGFLHDMVKVGDVVFAAQPQGDFYLPLASRRPVVLLSAGVGITPMLSMVEAIAQEPAPREVWFLHGSRNERGQAMRQYLRNLALAHPKIQVHFHHSQPDAWETAGQEYDAVGRLDVAFLQRQLPSPDADFYLCGPPAFIETLYEGLRTWGIADERLFYEYFGAGKSLRPPTGTALFSATAYTVGLARSGRRLAWTGAEASLLDLLEAHAVYPPSSCRQGTCLTCSTGLVSGEIGYEPEPLAEPFDGDILVCCAQPHSDLILDL